MTDREDFRVKVVTVPVRNKDKKRFLLRQRRNLSLIIIKKEQTVFCFNQKTAVADIGYLQWFFLSLCLRSFLRLRLRIERFIFITKVTI